VRLADESHRVVRINDPNYVNPQTKQTEHLDATRGEHGVTVSTGPSFESQRDEVSTFLDLMISNLQAIPAPPPALAKILALAIKMKNMGPLADEVADILSPPQDQAAAQQQIAQGMQTLQQQGQMIVEMQQELEKLRQEKAGKIVDNEYMLKKAQMDNELKLAIAEIETKAQSVQFRAQLESDLWAKLHDLAHDAAMQAVQHMHEKSQAAAAAQAAQQEPISASAGATSPA